LFFFCFEIIPSGNTAGGHEYLIYFVSLFAEPTYFTYLSGELFALPTCIVLYLNKPTLTLSAKPHLDIYFFKPLCANFLFLFNFLFFLLKFEADSKLAHFVKTSCVQPVCIAHCNKWKKKIEAGAK
jgi:hypothetical protein